MAVSTTAAVVAIKHLYESIIGWEAIIGIVCFLILIVLVYAVWTRPKSNFSNRDTMIIDNNRKLIASEDFTFNNFKSLVNDPVDASQYTELKSALRNNINAPINGSSA